MIPKIIHYCWFGGKPLPPLAKKCLASWKKFCPDYQLVRWDESSFDLSSAPLYVKQAYEAKKWAFVTDYVRLYAMTAFGGIYMDTDVEVVSSLDSYLHHEAFSGFEQKDAVPTGIMACRKDFPLFLEFLKYYDTASFYLPDGQINYTTNVSVMTNICLGYGLQLNGEYQEVQGFALYPTDVFCPVDFWTKKLNRTKNTATIHWFSGSWVDKKVLRRQKYVVPVLKFMKKLLGERRYEAIKKKLKR